jgi:redox-sensitive bicupin YhaK (pirin superfamily)
VTGYLLVLVFLGYPVMSSGPGRSCMLNAMSAAVVLPEPVFEVQRAAERATFDHGWLKTSHSFSFADYYDPRNVNWGALRVFNDDRVAPGNGFPTHPHRDMEIVTYVLEGHLQHRDSIGSHGVVGAGGVQYMSAGTGVRHSEYNHSGTEGLHFLQMWVQPARLGGAPQYGQMDFETPQRLNRWLTIASGQAGVEAPVALTQDATFLVSRLENATIEHVLAPGRLAFLFLATGEVTAAGSDVNGSRVGMDDLVAGDAVRIAGVSKLAIAGSGEVVLWDLPRLPDAAND